MRARRHGRRRPLPPRAVSRAAQRRACTGSDPPEALPARLRAVSANPRLEGPAPRAKPNPRAAHPAKPVRAVAATRAARAAKPRLAKRGRLSGQASEITQGPKKLRVLLTAFARCARQAQFLGVG